MLTYFSIYESVGQAYHVRTCIIVTVIWFPHEVACHNSVIKDNSTVSCGVGVGVKWVVGVEVGEVNGILFSTSSQYYLGNMAFCFWDLQKQNSSPSFSSCFTFLNPSPSPFQLWGLAVVHVVTETYQGGQR